VTAAHPSRSSWVVESFVFAGRLITGWRRHPVVPIQSILFPTALLVFYHLLAGKSLAMVTGTDNLEGLVPMCALAGGMFGAIGAGVGLSIERGSGLLSRFWTLPVHRASAITGRVLAEGARTLVGAVVITAVGLALGLRFQGSALAVVPFLLLPVMVAVTFSLLVMTLALKTGGNAVFMYLGSGSVGLAFCSPGVAPIDSFPPWLQPVVQYQPLAPAIESMRLLAEGDPATGTMLIASAWVVVLAAIFGPLAVRQYRIAAEAVQ
jgi:ABC-2 type transport system permease protein